MKCLHNTRNTFVLQATEAAAMLGIPFRSVTRFTQMLAGCVIPEKGVDVQEGWRQYGEKIFSAHVEGIKRGMGNFRFVLIHDCGKSNQGLHSLVNIVQNRTKSYCLPPVLKEKGTTWDAASLKVEIDTILTKLGLGTPFLLRSDRGGGDGGASRDLAFEWNIRFLSCLPHALSNVVTALQKHLKSASNMVYKLAFSLNYVLATSTRQSRWLAVQEKTQHDS